MEKMADNGFTAETFEEYAEHSLTHDDIVMTGGLTIKAPGAGNEQ